MSIVTLVRHGQASFFGPDYDELSDLGRQQGRTLGAWWRDNDARFDRVFAGPLNRHRQTERAVAGGYGESWPAPATLDGLVEHQSLAVLRHVIGDQALGATGVDANSTQQERHRVMRRYFTKYAAIVRDWATGEIEVPGVETWQQARRRVADALADLGRQPRSRIVAITSGGFVAMAVGELLGLDDGQVFELSLDVRNSSLTELRLSASRRSLLSFNAVPHLGDPARATLV